MEHLIGRHTLSYNELQKFPRKIKWSNNFSHFDINLARLNVVYLKMCITPIVYQIQTHVARLGGVNGINKGAFLISSLGRVVKATD